MDKLFRCFKPVQSKKGKREKQNNKHILACYNGCSRWQQELPDDIMEKILQHLDLSDRIRLSIVCKSWGSVAMRRDFCAAPQLPWLVVPFPNCNFSFWSLSEGKIHRLSQLKSLQGTWFKGSSKGWMIMITTNTEVFLFNPISRTKHQLPSLIAKCYDPALTICGVIALSTSDINNSECMVAAIFNSPCVLGLCRPGDKIWSVFHVVDENERITHILFSSGILYALVTNSRNKNGVVTSHILNFGDHVVELKLVYDNTEESSMDLNADFHTAFLSESNNEVLLIYQMKRYIFRGGDKPVSHRHWETSHFRVYKLDSKNDNLLRVQSLGDQLLFFAHDCSFSLPASDFKELKGNCIYFVISAKSFRSPVKHTSLKIGVFYLDGGRIEQFFATVNDYGTKWPKLSWLTPSL